MTTEPLDPAAIMAEHAFCAACTYAPQGPCLPYRLADEVIRWKRAWQGEDRSHAETQAENAALLAEVDRLRAEVVDARTSGYTS